ncbi:MAG: YceI family protein [Armatimonadetes bacterium]|nr:YceI family protein [Armatimonadota bacterium]
MHRFISTLLLMVLLAAPGLAQGSAWTLDAAHSRVGFSVRHLGISNVTGEFTRVSGQGTFDGKSIETASVTATIDTTSVNTREAKRDDHLRNADFLDVARYPTMTFKSKRFRKTSGNGFALTGDLTLHGVTRTVVLNGTSTPVVKDPWGSSRVGASATTTINRKDFGLTWNKALESGGLVVAEEVTITLDLEFVRDAK